MARIHMITFVATSATAWETGGIRIRNGGDGMNCSQRAAYGAYLARLNGQVKGHGRWHGLR